MNCLNCSKECSVKYCSVQCQMDYQWKLKKENIKTLNRVENSKSGRRYLIEVRGHQCEICKIKEWNNGILPLVMDHIDGNSDNWSLDNLRLICSNCDSQLPTYKGANRGNGRFIRRQRYKEGKSY